MRDFASSPVSPLDHRRHSLSPPADLLPPHHTLEQAGGPLSVRGVAVHCSSPLLLTQQQQVMSAASRAPAEKDTREDTTTEIATAAPTEMATAAAAPPEKE